MLSSVLMKIHLLLLLLLSLHPHTYNTVRYEPGKKKRNLITLSWAEKGRDVWSSLWIIEQELCRKLSSTRCDPLLYFFSFLCWRRWRQTEYTRADRQTDTQNISKPLHTIHNREREREREWKDWLDSSLNKRHVKRVGCDCVLQGRVSSSFKASVDLRTS